MDAMPNTRIGSRRYERAATQGTQMTMQVELLAKDLNAQGGVFCPNPKADMKIWNNHPKVYLDVARTGEAKCPYCGSVYKLRAGEHFDANH
jgi:uncharacterized Zn-finger protein